jgi:regulatory Fis family protein
MARAAQPEFVKRLIVLRIREAMLKTWGNQAAAAKMLNLSRSTVCKSLAWDEARIAKEMAVVNAVNVQ